MRRTAGQCSSWQRVAESPQLVLGGEAKAHRTASQPRLRPAAPPDAGGETPDDYRDRDLPRRPAPSSIGSSRNTHHAIQSRHTRFLVGLGSIDSHWGRVRNPWPQTNGLGPTTHTRCEISNTRDPHVIRVHVHDVCDGWLDRLSQTMPSNPQHRPGPAASRRVESALRLSINTFWACCSRHVDPKAASRKQAASSIETPIFIPRPGPAHSTRVRSGVMLWCTMLDQ